MKFVLWLVLGVLVVAWLLRGKKSLPPRAGRPARPDANSEPMLQCAHCGIHIPASEAVLDAASTPFCSDAHRLQHRSD
jgi:uncharacterized protein